MSVCTRYKMINKLFICFVAKLVRNSHQRMLKMVLQNFWYAVLCYFLLWLLEQFEYGKLSVRPCLHYCAQGVKILCHILDQSEVLQNKSWLACSRIYCLCMPYHLITQLYDDDDDLFQHFYIVALLIFLYPSCTFMGHLKFTLILSQLVFLLIFFSCVLMFSF